MTSDPSQGASPVSDCLLDFDIHMHMCRYSARSNIAHDSRLPAVCRLCAAYIYSITSQTCPIFYDCVDHLVQNN